MLHHQTTISAGSSGNKQIQGANYMQNIDIAHEFFYSDFNSYKRFNNVGYSDNLFYSYSTVIGAVVKSKFDNYILLVSEATMSSTTGKHISNLISACPFSFCRVPMRYGKRSFSLDECINDIIRILDSYTTAKLSLKANREGFIESYKQLIYIHENIQDIDSSVIEQYKPMFDLLNNSDEVKKLKATLREKARQEQIKAKAELNELLNTYNYLDLIEFAYDGYNPTIKFDDYNKTKTMQKKVRKALNPSNDLSFVWIENDHTIRTSKSVRVSIDIVKTGLKLWKHNKIKHGYKVGYYTVLEVRKDYIRIGCHKIAIDNIKALYEKLFQSKPEKIKELQVA